MNSSQFTYIKQLYNSPTAKTIGLRYGFYLLSALIMLIGCLITAYRIPDPAPPEFHSAWRMIPIEQSLAQPLQMPAILSDGVIWQELGDTKLRYQQLSGANTYHYDWIPGQVVNWAAIERRNDTLLIWRDNEDKLSIATLTLSGEQITAPIPLGRASDFRLIDRQPTLILWRESGSLYASTIDQAGRPILPTRIRENIGLYAAHPNGQIIWQEGNTLFNGILDFTQGVSLNSANSMFNWDEPPIELHLIEGLAGTTAIWGTAVQPDVTRYQLLVFAGENPNPIELSIHDLPLRWLNTNGYDITIATLDKNDIWKPLLVAIYLGVEHFTGIDDAPSVTGSPIAIGTDSQHMGWVTLDETLMPQLYISNYQYGSSPYIPKLTIGDWRVAMRDGLRYAPYGLLWLIAPLLSLLLIKFPPYQLPVVLVLYWLGKNILSFGLWNEYPTVLQDFSLSPLIALFGIALIAALMGSVGWIKTPAWIRYTVFCLTDALLTFAIFGAGVQSLRL